MKINLIKYLFYFFVCALFACNSSTTNNKNLSPSDSIFVKQIDTLLVKAKNLYESSDFQNSKIYADSAVVKTFKRDSINREKGKTKFDSTLAVAYNRRAGSNRVLGYYDSAWTDYNSSLEITDKTNDSATRFKSYFGLSVLFYYNQEEATKEQSDIAWEYIEKASALMKNINDSAKIIYFKCESSIISQDAINAQTFLDSLQELIKHGKVSDSLKIRAFIEEDKAKILILKSNNSIYNEQVVNHFNSCLSIHKTDSANHDNYQIAHVLCHKGNYLLKFQDKIDSAFACFKETDSIARKINDAFVQMKSARGLNICYKFYAKNSSKDNLDSAYHYLTISDSINSYLMRKSLFAIYTKGQIEETNIINQKVNLSEAKNKIVAIALFIGLLLFIVIYRLGKLSSKSIKKEEEINRRDAWLKISHVLADMKNDLHNEDDESIEKDLDNIAELLKNQFKSQYCCIGNVINNNLIISHFFPKEEPSVFLNNAYEMLSKLPIEGIFENGNNQNDNLKIYLKGDIIQGNIWFIRELKGKIVKPDMFENLILLHLFKGDINNQEPLAYVCLVNSQNSITNGVRSDKKEIEQLNLFGTQLSNLLNLIEDHKEVRSKKREEDLKIKDDDFADELEKHSGDLTKIFKEISKYFLEQFNLSTITFRVPVLNGTQDSILEENLLFPLRYKLPNGGGIVADKIIIDEYEENRSLPNLSKFNHNEEDLRQYLSGYFFEDSKVEKIPFKKFNPNDIYKTHEKFVLFIHNRRISENDVIIDSFDFYKNLYLIINLRPFQIVNKEEVEKRLRYLSNRISVVINDIINRKKINQINTLKNEIGKLKYSQKIIFSQVVEIVAKSINAEICSVFIYDNADNRLKLKATLAEEAFLEGDKKIRIDSLNRIEEIYYDESDSDSIILDTYKKGLTRLVYSIKMTGHSKKFREIPLSGVQEDYSILFVPLKNKSGKTIGVLKCMGKTLDKTELISSFWDFDKETTELVAAIVERLIEIAGADKDKDSFIIQVGHEMMEPLYELIVQMESGNNRIQRTYEDDIKSGRLILKKELNSFFDANASIVLLFKHLLNGLDIASNENSPKWELKKKPANIHQLILNAVQLFEQRSHSEKEITIQTNISKVPKLIVDEAKITQVIYNLLKNSINYAHPKSTINIYYGIKTEEYETYDNKICKNWHEIQFVNYGIGIPENEKDDIFLLYKRGSNAPITTSGKAQGLGIGLFLVQKIMKLHGGLCRVDNCHNPTKISVLLPIEN